LPPFLARRQTETAGPSAAALSSDESAHHAGGGAAGRARSLDTADTRGSTGSRRRKQSSPMRSFFE
jgi:hypothetical protein